MSSSGLSAQKNPYLVPVIQTKYPLQDDPQDPQTNHTATEIQQILTLFEKFVAQQQHMPNNMKQMIKQEAERIALMVPHQQHLEKMFELLNMYAALATRLTADIQQILSLAAQPTASI